MLKNDLIRGAAAAANYTGLDQGTIYRLCQQDEIPYVRLGHRLFFRKSELDQTFAGAFQRGGPSKTGSQSSINGRVA
ncbi:helix-turn-helix domain-containing protein [Porphyrobacter algicida]|uniref:Helix-turn-helix domain-containing protein n=1 Tax=Qipengyuania algicida TaxID=1836209 RepID=A0A845AK96_9SPHN|nr:helix-turn-helix domain-containing protein [Qipengyuania algicida]MXP29573.1 helix-turn-helix domain-containing protein [Qipengyuania algicida]